MKKISEYQRNLREMKTQAQDPVYTSTLFFDCQIPVKFIYLWNIEVSHSTYMDIHKILVIRLSSIGDIVLASPLVRALRKQYPSASIDFAIKKEFAVLMQYNPYINQLILVDSKDMTTAQKQVKENNYDWIIDIQRSSRASQLMHGSDAPLATSYSKQKWARFFLVQYKWNLYKQVKPVYQRYFEAVEKQGVKDDGTGTEIFLTFAEEKKVLALLPFLETNQPVVTICPGAKFNNKRWTKEGFIEVSRQLQSLHQAHIVVLGGPGEEALCQEIATSIGGKVSNLAGQLSLLESAAVLKHSRVVVANDSGLMHLAQSQKTPVVAIYGPTVKEFGFFPLETHSTVLETQLGCRPCTKMGRDTCPKGHHHCMKWITPADVYTAVQKYL